MILRSTFLSFLAIFLIVACETPMTDEPLLPPEPIGGDVVSGDIGEADVGGASRDCSLEYPTTRVRARTVGGPGTPIEETARQVCERCESEGKRCFYRGNSASGYGAGCWADDGRVSMDELALILGRRACVTFEPGSPLYSGCLNSNPRRPVEIVRRGICAPEGSNIDPRSLSFEIE